MSAQTQLRSFYRRILRELPTREPSLLANPSPIQTSIRSQFSSSSSSSSTPSPTTPSPETTEQIVQYLKAQRKYITLVERYNPGMNMSDETRVKLTARRVGMELSEALQPGFREKK